MMLFAGRSNPDLARRVSEHLNIPLGRSTVGHFSDGETMVEILENVRGCDVFVLQSTCAPANNYLMELLAIGDALRRASAMRITAVMPYFGYARQDRRVRSARVPITAKIVADMITSVGFGRLLTVDLHADQIQGFFTMPVDNAYATSVMMADIRERNYMDYMVVSPDVGGVVRARAIAKRLNNTELAIIDKRRSQPNQSRVMHIIGEVKDRDCMLVDDIVDTAGTLCSAAKALKDAGAKDVIAYGTHPVLSGKAINNLMNSEITELVVTDTIPLHQEAIDCPKIRCISLSEMLAQAIHRVGNASSVSELFSDSLSD